MKKRHLIILILLFFSQSSFSQGKGLLTGTVFDNDVVPFANVIISQDGEVITGTCTDSYGRYEISLQEGIYSVEASVIMAASEKTKIEIKANETKTLDFQLIEKRYDIVTAIDTINVNTFKVKEIDKKLKVAIDNHIKMAKRKFIFPNKKRNIIVVGIADRDYDYYDLEHIDINDVKLKHKQFKESQFGEGFNVFIYFLRRNDIGSELCYKKLFYYKYNDWDIFLGTQIEDLEFPFVDSLKNFEFHEKYKDIVYSITGKHKDNYKKTSKILVNRSSYKSYKRIKKYHTNYYISEREVESVTIKRKSILKN